METKEVTLRQCIECRICKKRTDEKDMYNDHWGEELIQSKCIKCVLLTVNRQKKQAGEKTEFVLIEKPRDQKLGEVIMDGYREDWAEQEFNEKEFIKDWEKKTKRQKEFYTGFYDYANRRIVKKYWCIFDEDTQDIQEKINNIKP